MRMKCFDGGEKFHSAVRHGIHWKTAKYRCFAKNLSHREKITVHGIGVMSDGWHNCFNIAWHWMEAEVNSVKEWMDGGLIEQQHDSSGLKFDIDPVEYGQFRAVAVDLGSIQTGIFELELSGCIGNEIV